MEEEKLIKNMSKKMSDERMRMGFRIRIRIRIRRKRKLHPHQVGGPGAAGSGHHRRVHPEAAE